jgi:hypothetical protein
MPEQQDRLTMSGPAEYRICVQGAIERSWTDLFAGMKVAYRNVATPGALTVLTGGVLTGGVLDQAELIGLLNRLYGLGLPLVSVQWRRGKVGGAVSRRARTGSV